MLLNMNSYSAPKFHFREYNISVLLIKPSEGEPFVAFPFDSSALLETASFPRRISGNQSLFAGPYASWRCY